jgi:hypothetical protein
VGLGFGVAGYGWPGMHMCTPFLSAEKRLGCARRTPAEALPSLSSPRPCLGPRHASLRLPSFLPLLLLTLASCLSTRLPNVRVPPSLSAWLLMVAGFRCGSGPKGNGTRVAGFGNIGHPCRTWMPSGRGLALWIVAGSVILGSLLPCFGPTWTASHVDCTLGVLWLLEARWLHVPSCLAAGICYFRTAAAAGDWSGDYSDTLVKGFHEGREAQEVGLGLGIGPDEPFSVSVPKALLLPTMFLPKSTSVHPISSTPLPRFGIG